MADIEEHIRKAMEAGKFDNLPGKGRRLNLNDNPLEDPEWRSAHRMLRNAGFTLPWIEKGNEIEIDLERARQDIRRAWAERRANPESPPVMAGWDRAVQRFSKIIADLNGRIQTYNIEVPDLAFQKKLLSVERELQKATHSESD